MKLLESDKSLDISSTSRFSIITITNYDYYQSQSTVNLTTNGQPMDTNNNVKNDKNVCIAKNRRYQHKQQLGDERPKFRSRDVFNPRVGRQSSQPTEEEKRTVVPKLKAEYQEKLAEYMRKEGIKIEEDVDPFKFQTKTEYITKRLREIRTKGRINNSESEAI